MKRKVLSVIMTGAMVAGLAGTVTVHAEEQQTYNIGICQLVQHEALDAATQGFKDALTEKMPDVKFDEQNAAGDAANYLQHYHQQLRIQQCRPDPCKRYCFSSGCSSRNKRYPDPWHRSNRVWRSS